MTRWGRLGLLLIVVVVVVVGTADAFVSVSAGRPRATRIARHVRRRRPPKTADEWAAHRRAQRLHTNAPRPPPPPERMDVPPPSNASVAVGWEERARFEALRHGNRLRQHDILRAHLGGL